MRLNNIVAILSFYGGLIILIIGLLLMFSQTTDTSFTFSKTGGVGTGTINGPGCIGLGVLILLFSWWSHREAKIEMRERDILIKKENEEFLKKKRKQSPKSAKQ